MVNPIFQSAPPRADTVNEAGGVAYALGPEAALAQFVVTGCFNNTFYAQAEDQLDQTVDLARRVEPEFLAKAAVYGRERARMKDAPAVLLAVLATRDAGLLEGAFSRVVDDARMLRGFVQVMRSGVVGRRSLGSASKRLVREWLSRLTPEALFRQSVGTKPTLGDVLRLAHPRPRTDEERALYGYLVGKEVAFEHLPAAVQAYERYRLTGEGELPDAPFQMLTSLDLGTEGWRAVARRASWTQTRMNLNTFARHGVFEDEAMVQMVASRLRDPAKVRRTGVYPYQLLAAHGAAGPHMPRPIVNALHDAMEIAVENVPVLEGSVAVCPDVSGSMGSPVTGYRSGATTFVRCVDVAALMAAAVLRRNDDAMVLPFAVKVHAVPVEPRDTVLTTAGLLASQWGGGTDCSAPLRELNRRGLAPDTVILVSDNESWVNGADGFGRAQRSTAVMLEWERLRQRNRRAKLVCIDVQPYATTQALDRADIMNVGGFGDSVFDAVARFASGGSTSWVDLVRGV